MRSVIAWPLLLLAACASGDTRPASAPSTGATELVGRLGDPAIAESSGIVASRRHPGVFWTHNDSGNAPALYAVDRAGRLVGAFAVDARNIDWEDIAIDDAGRLYIGDLGNNQRKRATVLVHRLAEPDPRRPSDRPLPVADTWELSFPDKPFDCEALFIHGKFGYVISKHNDATPAVVYRFPLEKAGRPVVLERVAVLPIRAPVTAADISADGRRLAVLTYGGLSVFDIGGDVAAAATVAPRFVPYVNLKIEACCFDGDDVLVTAESREVLRFASP